ncbi:MAG: hypothetical protein QM564_09675 [Bergeyella sp.]
MSEAVNNTKRKYSDMLLELYNEFEMQFPESLSFEDVIQHCVDAWNTANYIERKSKKGYANHVKGKEYPEVMEKIVAYKLDHFKDCKNIILDFSLENDILNVHSVPPKDFYNEFFKFLEIE